MISLAMPISNNAAPDELDSPFFVINEDICQTFEEFIAANGGQTQGKYNAYSYNILGKMEHPYKWEFNIKKASFTSGNLLLSSKYQNLHVASLWTANNLKSDCPPFRIKQKTRLNFLTIGLSKNWNWFSNNKKYCIQSPTSNHPLILDLKKKLIDLFHSNRIWEITYKTPILKIELRSEKTHTETIEKLLE